MNRSADRQDSGSASRISDAIRFGTGSSWVLLGLGAGRGIRLITRVLIGRLLGAASLGLFELAWTAIQILTFSARAGLPLAVLRFGAPLWSRNQRDGLQRLTLRALFVPLLFGILLAVMLGVAAPWLASTAFDEPELASAIRILAAAIPLGAGLAVLAAAVQATQKMRATALARDLAEPLFQFLLFLALWALGLKLAAALWGTLIGVLLAFALALVVLLRLTTNTDRRYAAKVPPLRDLIAFSLPVAATGILGAYLLWIDRILVGYFLSAREVGVYAAAAQFGVIFPLLLHGFSTMFTPMFAELIDQGETKRMGQLYRVATKWGLYLLLPLMAVMVVVPETLLGGLFGGEFIAGSLPLQILLIGQFVNVCSGHAGMILILGGRQRAWMLLNAVAVCLNVVLDILLIPNFGLIGAAAASAFTLAVLYASAVFLVYYWLSFSPLDCRFLKLIASTLAAVVVLFLLRWLGLGPSLPGLATALSFAYGAAVVTHLAFNPDAEDRELVSALGQQLRGRRPESRLP